MNGIDYEVQIPIRINYTVLKIYCTVRLASSRPQTLGPRLSSPDSRPQTLVPRLSCTFLLLLAGAHNDVRSGRESKERATTMQKFKFQKCSHGSSVTILGTHVPQSEHRGNVFKI